MNEGKHGLVERRRTHYIFRRCLKQIKASRHCLKRIISSDGPDAIADMFSLPYVQGSKKMVSKLTLYPVLELSSKVCILGFSRRTLHDSMLAWTRYELWLCWVNPFVTVTLSIGNKQGQTRPQTFLPLTRTCLGSNPTVWRMFSILARSIPRRALIQSVRCLSQNPPVLPASSNNQAKPPLKPETSNKPAESTPINKPVEPKPMSSVPTLDFSPPEPSEEAQKTGAMSSKGYKTASERTRRTRTRISLAILFLALGVNAVYMGREWEEEELKMKKMVCSERFSCHQY